MQATQSFTASGLTTGMYSRSGSFTGSKSIRTAAPAALALPAPSTTPIAPPLALLQTPPQAPSQGRAVSEDEGLSHDARNLLGALNLYCDLLAIPGVLKPEHLHFADELRMVGSRSLALIDRLTQTPRDGESPSGHPTREGDPAPLRGDDPVSLRDVVGNCLGLLTQVAGGRPIVARCGVAASAPVRITREKVERILLNLVRNSAASMAARPRPESELSPIHIEIGFLSAQDGGQEGAPDDAQDGGHDGGQEGAPDETPAPWPLRRVRLTVIDSGCGMTREHLDRVLRAPGIAARPGITARPEMTPRPGMTPRPEPAARPGHGIGLRIVRELVADSGGDLRIMSNPGAGTAVQIEWPVAPAAHADDAGRGYLADETDEHVANGNADVAADSARGVSC